MCERTTHRWEVHAYVVDLHHETRESRYVLFCAVMPLCCSEQCLRALCSHIPHRTSFERVQRTALCVQLRQPD